MSEPTGPNVKAQSRKKPKFLADIISWRDQTYNKLNSVSLRPKEILLVCSLTFAFTFFDDQDSLREACQRKTQVRAITTIAFDPTTQTSTRKTMGSHLMFSPHCGTVGHRCLNTSEVSTTFSLFQIASCRYRPSNVSSCRIIWLMCRIWFREQGNSSHGSRDCRY